MDSTPKPTTFNPPPIDSINLSVKVIYHDLWEGWKEIEEELNRRLPLMHISWTVFNIDVDCKQLDNLVFEPAGPSYVLESPKEYEWHNEPYLHILPVVCPDRKTYDTTVSQQITQWLADKTNVEWIILYISLPNDPSRKATFFNNTWHYLRRDYNTMRGQERVAQIQVPGPTEKEDEEGWERFLRLMKQSIVRHGQAGMSQCIQETRRLDAQRVLLGWDFPQFFVVKEGLAFIYETFQMYEEALMQYDELEALFASDLFPFGGDQPGDDSGQIFHSTPRGYRQMIIYRTISEFYFRQYVFTRQAKLLFNRGLPVQVAERGLRFIRGLEKDMAKRTKIKPMFIWSWAFGAYMDLAAACKPFVHLKADPTKVSKEKRKMQKKDKQQLNILLADIYLNSSLLLQQIGVTLQFLPQDAGDYLFSAEAHVPFVAFAGYGGSTELNVHDPATDDLTASEDEGELQPTEPPLPKPTLDDTPVSPSPSEEPALDGPAENIEIPKLTIIEAPEANQSEKLTYTPRTPHRVEKYEFSYFSLRQAVQHTANFDRLYKAITKKAIRCYHAGHRQRSVNWLQYTLATMHFHRGTPESYNECMNLLSTVVKSHSLNNANEASAWPPLLFAAYNKLCECYRRAGHHEDYVDTLLHLLLYKELAPGPEYWQYYFTELLRVIHNPQLLPNLLAKEHFLSLIDIDLNVPQQIEQEQLPSHLQHQSMIPRSHLTQRTRQFPLDAVIDIECSLTNKLPNELKINYLCLQMIILLEEEDSNSDEDVETEIPTERRLILERHDLLLKPLATSKIQLQLKPHQVGTFVCNKLWIAMGNLLLTRSIPETATREKKAGITVVPSVSTLSLKVTQPPAMLLQQPQALTIIINTNKDTFCQAQLEITRAPQPQIKGRSGKTLCFLKSTAEQPEGEEKLNVIIIDQNGTKSEIAILVKRKEGGLVLVLPDSSENTCLTVVLPVQADNSTSVTHSVKVDLNYAKVTGEQFKDSAGLQLHFVHPFKVEQVTIPVHQEGQDTVRQAYLRAIAANICGVPIKLVDYQVNLKALTDTHKIVYDPNEPVKGITLQPEQKVSLLFKIAYDSTIPSKPQITSAEQATLTLSYQIDTPESVSQIFSFPSKVYPVHSLVDLNIDLKYPKTGTKANRVKFTWEIEVVAGAQISGSVLQYSIHSPSKMWLIGAKQTGVAQLQATDDPAKPFLATIVGTLIPVCSGVLPLPTLKFDGIAAVRTRLKYAPETGILIFPTPCLTSGCTSAVLTDEESKILGSMIQTTITEIRL